MFKNWCKHSHSLLYIHSTVVILERTILFNERLHKLLFNLLKYFPLMFMFIIVSLSLAVSELLFPLSNGCDKLPRLYLH